MNTSKPQIHPEKTNLSIVKKSDAEKMNAKLITIKKKEENAEIMLPPQQEKYIKAKKHDFL